MRQPISISNHCATRFRENIRADARNVKGALVALWYQSQPATYEDMEGAHLQRYEGCSYHTAIYHYNGPITVVMAVEYAQDGPVMSTVKRRG